MNKYLIIILFVSVTACQGTGNKDPETSRDSHGQRHQNRSRARGNHESGARGNILITGDTAYVPSISSLNAKLELQTIDLTEHLLQFTTTAVVRPISGNKAEIATPFEGRIARTFIKLGQKVKTGSPLFEVSSSDYMESVRMYMQAYRERELAEKNLTRKKDLMDSGISSKKEFDEAKLEFDLADKELEKTEAILRIFNIDPGDADLAIPLIVRSPISGEVVRTDITVGQYLKSDSDPILTIADLDKVLVVASVREKDLGSVNLRDQVEISTESHPDKAVNGLVNYIGNIMNEETRTVEVFIECENPGSILKCGMFVTAKFYHKLDNAIIIPSSAVLQDYDKSYIFIKADHDKFLKREITVTSIPGKRIIVRTGLSKGDIIVSEGGIYLK
ncbi:MAG: efflux RND transporter periplasmic adaptor subunit [Bacteroidota bacterium]